MSYKQKKTNKKTTAQWVSGTKLLTQTARIAFKNISDGILGLIFFFFLSENKNLRKLVVQGLSEKNIDHHLKPFLCDWKQKVIFGWESHWPGKRN